MWSPFYNASLITFYSVDVSSGAQRVLVPAPEPDAKLPGVARVPRDADHRRGTSKGHVEQVSLGWLL